MAWIELKSKVYKNAVTRFTRRIDNAFKQRFSTLLAQTDWSCIVDSGTVTDPGTAYLLKLIKSKPCETYKKNSQRHPGLLKSCKTKLKLHEIFIKPLTVEKISLKHCLKQRKFIMNCNFLGIVTT